jgi:oligopeptidase A
MTLVGHLESVATSPALRGAYNAVQPPVAAFYAGLPLDPGLWRALRAYAAPTTPRSSTAPAVASSTRPSTTSAATAPSSTRPASSASARSTSSSPSAPPPSRRTSSTPPTSSSSSSPTRRARRPPRRQPARAARERRGPRPRRLALHACRSRASSPRSPTSTTRDPRARLPRLQHARRRRPPFDNRPLIAKILELRREKAEAARLRRLRRARAPRSHGQGRRPRPRLRRRPHARSVTSRLPRAENDDLLEVPPRARGPRGAAARSPWDLAYYAEKQRRPATTSTTRPCARTSPPSACSPASSRSRRRLYGVRVQRATDLPVWHPASVTYASSHDETGLIGYFYVDLYPREEKRGGAWMNPLITGRAERRGARAPPSGSSAPT